MSSPEDSYLYLSATEEKLIANDNSNVSFLAYQHANKKKLQKFAWMAFFFRELTKSTTSKEAKEVSELKIMVKSVHSIHKKHILASYTEY